ncbi:MAG: hypothetical protein ABI792_06195, partial [bacterium]
SRGEFFLTNRCDPSYVYLLNSLNLSRMNGLGVGHIDHPGTTVQEAGAAVIYFLQSETNDKNDITADVFSHPEFYLSKINFFLVVLNSIALFVLGFVSLNKLNDIRPALVLQLMPFFSISVYTWIINVSPEPLLVFAVILLFTIVISHTSDKLLKTKKIISYVILYGLICGFGLATKISFFPLLIIPLILIKRISFKLLFCLVTLIVFFIFVYPAISPEHLYRFLNWIRKLVAFSGKYGTGEKNFIDIAGIPKSFVSIFTNEPVFVFSYILIFIAFLLQFIKRFRLKIKSNRCHKLLNAVFLAMTIQIIIVIKHFELHYLIPGYLLIVAGLFAVNSIAAELFPRYLNRSKYIYLYIILIIFSILQCSMFVKTISEYSSSRNASHDAIDYINKNYKQNIIVNSYGSSSEEFALYLGATLCGIPKYEYYSMLKKMFPKNYYYDKWSENLENIDNINNVKNNIINSGRFVFHSGDETVVNDFLELLRKVTERPDINYKKVFTAADGECIYEFTFFPN